MYKLYLIFIIFFIHPPTSRIPSLLASTSAGIKFLSGGPYLGFQSPWCLYFVRLDFRSYPCSIVKSHEKFQEILSGTLHCTLMEMPHLVTRTSNPGQPRVAWPQSSNLQSNWAWWLQELTYFHSTKRFWINLFWLLGKCAICFSSVCVCVLSCVWLFQLHRL